MLHGRNGRILGASLLAGVCLLLSTPTNAPAQGRDMHATTTVAASVTLSSDTKVRIRRFYVERGAVGAKALPPGIRKRLARGKPLPPGIAKKVAPARLRGLVRIPAGYEIVEVGLDVLLVELATSIIHDVLMDAVR